MAKLVGECPKCHDVYEIEGCKMKSCLCPGCIKEGDTMPGVINFKECPPEKPTKSDLQFTEFKQVIAKLYAAGRLPPGRYSMEDFIPNTKRPTLIKSARVLINYFRDNAVYTVSDPDILIRLIINLEKALNNHVMEKLEE